jgi:hypothetical protein
MYYSRVGIALAGLSPGLHWRELGLEDIMSTMITLPDDRHAQVRALAEDTGRPLEVVLAEAVA